MFFATEYFCPADFESRSQTTCACSYLRDDSWELLVTGSAQGMMRVRGENWSGHEDVKGRDGGKFLCMRQGNRFGHLKRKRVSMRGQTFPPWACHRGSAASQAGSGRRKLGLPLKIPVYTFINLKVKCFGTATKSREIFLATNLF